MGTDQGKTWIVGAAVLAGRAATCRQGQATALPPYTAPIAWGAMAGQEVGKHFQPVRRVAACGA